MSDSAFTRFMMAIDARRQEHRLELNERMKAKQAKNGSMSRIAVGSRVLVNFGGRETGALVVEDRGDLGVDGMQVIRVRVDLENGAREYEVYAHTVKGAT